MGNLDGFKDELDRRECEKKELDNGKVSNLNLGRTWAPYIRICLKCGYINNPWGHNLRCTACKCSNKNKIKRIHYHKLLYLFGNKETREELKRWKKQNQNLA